MKNKLNCVLLIDDDEPTNYFNRLVLESAGCVEEIHVAESGQLALHYLENSCGNQNCPNLIFLDINMPAMNGWEFLELYSCTKKCKRESPVVVMLTTSLNPDNREKADSIPEVSVFETKPLTNEKLEAILRKHFPDCNS